MKHIWVIFLVALAAGLFGKAQGSDIAKELVAVEQSVNGDSAIHSARQPFVGAWRTVSVIDTLTDGTEVPDLYLGSQPTGLLIYDSAGYMCGGNMNPNRPKWTKPSRPTMGELASAAGGYDSFCGTYEVTESQGKIVHHVRVALDPNEVGAALARTFAFEGNRLKLSGTEGLEPGLAKWTYTFERVASID